nr:immunoglobulin light chain junction region [Macaca mulatta]
DYYCMAWHNNVSIF